MISIQRNFSIQKTSNKTVIYFFSFFVVQQSFAKIVQIAFNSPVIVHDYMSFAMLTQKFKTNIFVIYCDNKKQKRLYN